MKRLALIRHAQAEPQSRHDLERVLSGRGREEAARIGCLVPGDWPPFDLALVSPSARTRETWDLIARGATTVRFDRRIYDASLDALLSLLADIDDRVGSAVLVGHNPGIGELAAALIGGPSSIPAHFPTAGAAFIQIPVEAWRDVSPGRGLAIGFVSPA